MSRRAVLVSIGIILLFVAAGIAVVSVHGLSWRAEVIALKFRGELSELSWPELIRMLNPEGPYYLEPILSTRNPYTAITNPYTSDADTAVGQKEFRAQCSTCHGADGTGASGPNLAEARFRHGDSDWALYRTVSRGIPGTAMQGRDLPERSIWQIVAFIRSLSTQIDKAGETDQGRRQTRASPVSYEQLIHADKEAGNWLMYSGTYDGHRHSRLDQIDRENAPRLQLIWAFPFPVAGNEDEVEATPLVVDGIMYVTEPPNNVLALDAASGDLLWSYNRELPDKLSLCCASVNRGVALLDDRVYIKTLDAHLVALDANNGAVIWDTEVADWRSSYTGTGAPLAIDGKIIAGVAGGDFGIRGFVDAYDAESGERLWRFYTIPGPGEPGIESWAGDSWETGGGPTWITGSFDPELNLIYWGVGNPAPVYQADARKGDNLYTNSVVALDADSGELRWYFQFSPADEHDWDANQVPVLIDRDVDGEQRKLILWANRNGFYYVLDRVTGEFLSARAFIKQTWAEEIDASGRPVLRPDGVPSAKGTLMYPSVTGGTNWWSPAYSPLTDLFYVPMIHRAGIFFNSPRPDYNKRKLYLGSSSQSVTDIPHWTGIRALSSVTGELQWEYRHPPRKYLASTGGLLSTGGNLIFGGDDTNFFALDAETGQELWRARLGGMIHVGPISYLAEDRQLVSVSAGRVMFTFGLAWND